MMIDFIKMEKLIPEKGALAISIQRLDGGELQVMVAPRFNERALPKYAKGDDKMDMSRAISPITFNDTAENFNREFEQTVTEIMELKGQLLSATAAASRSVSSVSAKKKDELKKAIERKAAASKKGDENKDKENEAGAGDTLNLFTAAKNPEASQPDESSAGEQPISTATAPEASCGSTDDEDGQEQAGIEGETEGFGKSDDSEGGNG